MRRIFLISVIFSSLSAAAQDLHFSQFMENPALLNPALCGVGYNNRFSLTFKDQWGSVTSPFRTFGAAYDAVINRKKKKQKVILQPSTISKMAAGLSVFNDVAGDGRLGSTMLNLTSSAIVPLNKISNISAGLQASLVQRSLNSEKLIFPDQMLEGQGDPVSGSNEDLTFTNFKYADLAAGISFNFGDNTRINRIEDLFNFSSGFAFYHLLRPREIFLRSSVDRVYTKFVFHANLSTGIRNTNAVLEPAFMLELQGPSKELIAGVNYKTFFNDNSRYTGLVQRNSFAWGVYYRLKDALIINTSYSIHQRYTIGISYDINLSLLSAASHFRGGMELTLKITPGASYLYEEKMDP